MLTRSLQALVALVCVAWAVAPTGAQMDLSKILVGKWEGQVELVSGSLPRILIIISARE